MRKETELTLLDGLATGFIGYVAVALSTAVLNLLIGRSILYTPALFGSALFYGLSDPAQLEITPAPVFAYNMVHLLSFLVIGLFASWLVNEAEKYPAAQFFILFLLLFVAAHIYTALVIFARPLLGSSSWWEIGLAGVIAAVAMAWYLWRKHPLLRQELSEIPMGTVPEDLPQQ